MTVWAVDDTPADGQGVCGVYDNRYRDVLWTFKGRKKVPDWVAGSYSLGAEVFIAGDNTFNNQTGNIYISLVNNNSSNPETSNTWQKTEHDDGKYWSEFTIAWNEIFNRFKMFLTPIPNIYLEWNNGYLSPSPVEEQKMYINDKGNYGVWYDTQEADGFIELIMHSAGKIDSNVMKRFLSMDINSEIRPYKIEFETRLHKTITVPFDGDVEQFLTNWFVPLKNDILTSSNGQNPEEDTSELFGNYILIRFFYEKKVYQRLVSAVIKFNSTSRVYTT
jgi:hypothetical protein